MNRRSISNSIVRLAALGTILASGSRLVAQERPLPPLAEYSIRLSDSIVFEVDPRIELLSGAQSATSWVRDSRGPGGGDNRYFNELSALFKPFSGSRGVRESQAMTRRGFSYDAPPAFVLSLDGGAAMLPPAEGWSEYLVRRAGSAARLDAFASALAKLYEDAEFEGFLAKHEEDYRRWLSEASDGFDAASVSAWIEDFYGRPSIPAEYRFVFAPAMFPGGGYGFSRVVGDGDDRRMLVYQVVRAQGSADGGPGFPSGSSLAML
ncbi:MAG: DUF4932 domain-containing protein, partial [Spirochaetes bacterium]|nr:DUF4932 domain-containing protein [Spirochaetota bacterium]